MREIRFLIVALPILVLTEIVTNNSHPLPRWLALGVRACVNTDNTLLSSVDAPEEWRRAAGIP